MHNLINFFDQFFPLSSAESWDNVGLLIPPSYTKNSKSAAKTKDTVNNIQKVILTINFTNMVLKECIEKKVKMVITYHPVIFHPIKKIHQSLVEIISNGISVLSVHTSLDNKMNEEMLNKIFCSEKNMKNDELKTLINQHKNHASKRNRKNENVQSQIINSKGRTFIDYPSGSLEEIVQKVKEIFHCDTVMVARGEDHYSDTVFKRVYCGVGSGKFPNCDNLLHFKAFTDLDEKIQSNNEMVSTNISNFDFYNKREPDTMRDTLIITGEMSHHTILHYTQNNNTVILLEHWRSEKWFLGHLKKMMEEKISGYEFIISEYDKCPIIFE